MGEKILMIGSPRGSGNSDMLADAFIKGAEESGHSAGSSRRERRK